jgi:hypothetical protein
MSMNARIVAIAVAVLALLALLRFQPWRGSGERGSAAPTAGAGRESLTVGFLPVT